MQMVTYEGSTKRGQKRASVPVELELQIVVSYLMWEPHLDLHKSWMSSYFK